MLVTCCNPSRGVLWYGWIKLRLLVRCEPGHEKGNCLRAPDRSYLSDTFPRHRKLEGRDQKSLWMQVKLQISLAECRVAVQFPKRTFAFHLQISQ